MNPLLSRHRWIETRVQLDSSSAPIELLGHQAMALSILDPHCGGRRQGGALADQIRGAVIDLVAGQRGQNVAVIIAVFPRGHTVQVVLQAVLPASPREHPPGQHRATIVRALLQPSAKGCTLTCGGGGDCGGNSRCRCGGSRGCHTSDLREGAIAAEAALNVDTIGETAQLPEETERVPVVPHCGRIWKLALSIDSARWSNTRGAGAIILLSQGTYRDLHS
mmetsp:Transcript_73480/g.175249  ORF Transcript_73480/g.175249 Transcript_73480/m.175249 type:complete len:221 (-) Transcript_73480:3049-3711(-)